MQRLPYVGGREFRDRSQRRGVCPHMGEGSTKSPGNSAEEIEVPVYRMTVLLILML